MNLQPEKIPPRYSLKLFITGRTAKSDLAVANIQQFFAKQKVAFDLVVIDLLESPQLAEEYRIMATPTLLKTAPLPVQRIIGDFTDVGKVAIGLGFAAREQ